MSGVATKLCSSLGDKKFMSDIVNHGILIQFESLLSTYGNEMGMLEVQIYLLFINFVQCSRFDYIILSVRFYVVENFTIPDW